MKLVVCFAVIRTLTGHKSNIRSLDFHPYGDFVASGSLDTNIKVSAVFLISDVRVNRAVLSLCNCAMGKILCLYTYMCMYNCI